MRSDTGARMLMAWLRQHAEKIDDAPDTLCSYRRELERLLFRCLVKRGSSPSSPTVADREGYEAFLASPSAAFCEPLRAARGLCRGRPLGDEPMAFDARSVYMTVGRCRQCIDAAKLHAAHLGEWQRLTVADSSISS
ncbi:hypothetical protein [Burkholderia plantarii]|uniref:hypothetical protein n=1 Tax=Burkholderia plantarii TaxID=41899 RepID=UPI0018DCA2A9|nr:hypothetical protein [Burkholderia plantarii]MBI0330274.1 hypothetical protein [Burkholderia plantarii]